MVIIPFLIHPISSLFLLLPSLLSQRGETSLLLCIGMTTIRADRGEGMDSHYDKPVEGRRGGRRDVRRCDTEVKAAMLKMLCKISESLDEI